jgi:branched-chain amino acid transport system ATP-binding protein
MTIAETNSESSLVLDQVSAWYGRAQALFDCSLELRSKEVVGLLGRNGAGKSTLMRAVFGAGVRRTGKVLLGDVRLDRLSIHMVSRAGVAWVPDSRRVFTTLSVRENLELARKSSTSLHRPALAEIVETFPLLGGLLDRRGRELSGGEQQVVAVARALAAGPSVLLIDEPTEGLAPTVVEQLVEALKSLPERFGVSVLIAEENAHVMLQLTDTFYALDVGHVIYDPRKARERIHDVEGILALFRLRVTGGPIDQETGEGT